LAIQLRELSEKSEKGKPKKKIFKNILGKKKKEKKTHVKIRDRGGCQKKPK
jgi:hypothetical protein